MLGNKFIDDIFIIDTLGEDKFYAILNENNVNEDSLNTKYLCKDRSIKKWNKLLNIYGTSASSQILFSCREDVERIIILFKRENPEYYI